MHEEVMYPVCPHRNVPAAFERFLGPDSGGIERFLPSQPPHRTDETLLIVKAAAQRVSEATGEFNAGLWMAWIASAGAVNFLAARVYQAGVTVSRTAAVLIRRMASLPFGSRSMAARLDAYPKLVALRHRSWAFR